MKYIIDSDILIYFLKGQAKVVEHITKLETDEIATTIINHTELLFGAFNSEKKKQNLELIENFLDKVQILAFCKDSSYIFAEQKALLKKQGKIIADMDLMIASIAIQNHGILVTNNTKHFDRINKLKIENWST